jgi:hypothetical protein
MNPTMIHEDGTECHHEGAVPSTLHDDGGPICPAGRPITHVLFNGKTLTIGEAYSAFSSIADTMTRAFAPLAEAFAEFARKIGTDPQIRALAAYAEALKAEEGSGHG